MIQGGDELSRTALGNNNAYAQDNATNWYDWKLRGAEPAFLEFVRGVIGLRMRFSQLRRSRFERSEQPVPGASLAAAWHDLNGDLLSPHAWDRDSPRALQLFLPGEPDLLILFNADHRQWEFHIAAPPDEQLAPWRVELDTNCSEGSSHASFTFATPVPVAAESMLVLSRDRAVRTR
jgi:glycogen operon protein